MLTLTQKLLMLGFITLLNLGVGVIAALEFRRARRSFVALAALAQMGAVFWQCVTIWLALRPEASLAPLASGLATWLFSLCYALAIRRLDEAPIGAAPFYGWGAIAIVGVALEFVATGAGVLILWAASTLALLTAPVLSGIGAIDSAARRVLLIVLQVLIAGGFLVGATLLASGRGSEGGIIYFVTSVLMPVLTYVFVQMSIDRSTDAIEEQEARYGELFEALRDGYLWLDEEGVVDVASPSVEAFGLRPDALPSRSLTEVLGAGEVVDRALAVARRDGASETELRLRVDDVVRECEMSVLRLDRSRQGGFSVTLRDVTERNLLERQFLDAQRRESLGVLAGGVAHDFNNLLQSMLFHAEVLAEELVADAERVHSARRIVAGAETAGELCRRLLEYTGRAHSEFGDVEFVDFLRETASLLESAAEFSGRLHLEAEADQVMVAVDRIGMKQVLLNVIRNAFDASPADAPVHVALRRLPTSESGLVGAAAFGQSPATDRALCIDVRDEGVGIEPETLRHIFDPFFTTREDGHGLGLSAVLGILEQHGGGVLVSSIPGAGTCFRILLPLSSAAEAEAVESAPTPLPSGRGTVLVVDDDPEILSVTERSLTRRGYQVYTCRDGQEALEFVQARGAELSLVFSDVRMPRLDGYALLEAVRGLYPKLGFVLSSGYAHMQGSDQVSTADVPFVPKPYRQQDLHAVIDRVLAH